MAVKGRSQCLVIRDRKILMVRHRQNNEEWNCLPGGRIDLGESPEKAALRELEEECNVKGRIIKQTSVYADYDHETEFFTFLVDIGDQEPLLGFDPEIVENPILIGLGWFHLHEICERDRAFLWAAGLISIDIFAQELLTWSDDISYPQQK